MLPLLALLVMQTTAIPSCTYDRAAMLALDEQAFDQDMAGGWRTLADSGCEREAADLIRDWREAHSDLRRRYLSHWHEGQLRANAGQTAAAITLFDRSRKTAAEDAGFGWNHYVDGSIAFLRRDRAGLETARARLATTSKPAGTDLRGPDGKPAAVRWPMNLNVLDGFRRCWDRPYKVAYGPACSAPTNRLTKSVR